ncbi:archaetidylserine decarboxylase [Endozoicomonas sp. SCSIO W0465]|uniref:archaetidylserine decarboxylase n=1 Tax=Endozoicomonas sp. SCSIO W0465 TaxID=2918516 RepID=UPI002074FCFC|nr:archaetidylserine decarboxylase [Endozoicomonas sp. SCSIO W0465]USE33857.1 archaetidylserine decarboxylase [Endozoicomonas sp. SCSIO W0465]
MNDSIPSYLQRVLPHQLINCLAYHIAEKQWPWFKNHLITDFIARNNIDMSEALHENPEHYRSFNDFFTRALKQGVRPLPEDPDLIISPVDGTISQIGPIENDRIIQAKHHNYSLSALFAGDKQLASRFKHGQFSTIYLSPSDYHRIHMPTSGTLQQMIYVPGSLYSVNAATTNDIEGLYARNERVISIFATDVGEMAVIMVGAMVVGSMETVWAGPVKPKSRQITWQSYKDRTVYLKRGDEMGRFKLGSTTIVLFANPEVRWFEYHQPGNKIKMGTAIGSKLD